jgi:hypothetical protein
MRRVGVARGNPRSFAPSAEAGIGFSAPAGFVLTDVGPNQRPNCNCCAPCSDAAGAILI